MTRRVIFSPAQRDPIRRQKRGCPFWDSPLGIWFTIYPFPWPIVLGPIVVAVWVLLGWWRISRLSPEKLAQAGQFNVPTD